MAENYEQKYFQLLDTYREYVAKVEQTRKSQKAYFLATYGSREKRKLLEESKALEKDVDEFVHPWKVTNKNQLSFL